MIHIAYLLFVMMIVFDVETDVRLISAGRAVRHGVGTLLFVGAQVVLVLLLVFSGMAEWRAAAFFTHLLALRWLLFDYLLNIRRGLDGFRYTGVRADAEEDSVLDGLLERLGWRLGLALKLALCAATIVPLLW